MMKSFSAVVKIADKMIFWCRMLAGIHPHYADALAFAVAADFPTALLPVDVGLIVAAGLEAGWSAPRPSIGWRRPGAGR